ncbi:DMT family transporter [Comamonas endophytica]|uniref:DMT family transporter n=1 Tax=Comamonas endophytica TaxID=2949090 RepID=A0ABY6GFP2_9BURK|nr:MULTISPECIES: DMT family transporter [unclassified Acidovorax]MCD2513388.1 DMT family transporter [Acidovorax sp. D4N7]UYG53829.1 DMT family transporter [Acidovorax sp. 5MLIR]
MPSTSASIRTTHLRLLGMAALWGASWPWGRVIAQTMPPLAAASLRFVLASLALLLWMHWRGGLQPLLRLTSKQWLGLACAAAFGVLGYSTFFMLGVQLVPAGKASIVVTLNPAATLLLAALLFGERLNARIALGMVLAVVGAWIAIAGGVSMDSWLEHSGRGELLLLGCVASWVAYTLIGRVVLKGLDALTTTTVTSLIGAAMLGGTSLAMEGTASWGRLAATPWTSWACLAALALGATAVAYAWFFDGVKTLGAGAAAGYISLVPVFGILFSSLWLGEALHPSLLIGGGIAVAGMAIMHFARYGWPRRQIAAANT